MNSKIIINNRFQRIINVLLLNASFIDNLGLMNGKMGIAIFFFHLSRETKNQIYENYAGELIDEIYDEITVDTPLDFENGLAGIGWGIEYLVQNGFLEADTDEVLEDFDNRLIQHFVYNTPTDIGLLRGISGLGAYFLKRIQNPNSNDENIKTLVNKELFIKIIDELDRKLTNDEIERLQNGKMELIENSLEPLIIKNNALTEENFKLISDYPFLLWFLSETYEQNIFNFKVEKIIFRLLSPLTVANKMPQMKCNRLLLVMALEKIKSLNFEQYLDGSIDEMIKKLLTGIDREAINKELIPDSAYMKNGTSGISFIYSQLFRLTGEHNYKKESLHWQTSSFKFDETDQGYAGFNVAKENEGKTFGLLSGLAGIAFLDNKC